MKRTSIFLVLLLGVAATAMAFAQQKPKTSDTSALQDLLKEKRDVLKKRFELMKAYNKIGKVKDDEYFDAEMDLLDAELELTTSEPDRLRVLKLQLENRRSLEGFWKQRRSLDPAGPVAIAEEHYMATAKRIDAEIALLRFPASEPTSDSTEP